MPSTVRPRTAKPEPLVVLNSTRYLALVAALDAAVAEDPSLAAARALLLTPLRLLESLARDAPGALGDDVLAAERLRLLLALAATQMPPLTAFRDVLGGDAKTGTTVNAAALAVPAIPCDDAVVHNGALVVVALAAGRVGKGTGLAEPLVNNVLVTALAAGPAEAVSRALTSGMGAAQVRALLAGLAHAENGQDRRLSAVIATFLADACERARWACLETLFALVRAEVARNVWDAAGTGGIVSVEPRTACPGQKVEIRVEPVDAPTPVITGATVAVLAIGTPEATLDAAHFLPLLERRAASVVFASQGHRSVSRLPDAVDPETGTITVTVPANAHVGWLGFADPALLEQTNRDRQALREEWEARNQSETALRGAPVPVQSIPLLRNPPTPPRSPLARFDGGTPIIHEAALTPPVVDPGADLKLHWRVQGGIGVHIDPRPGTVAAEGDATVQAPTDSVHAGFTLVAENGCGEPVQRTLEARVRVVIKSVVAEQPDRAAPLPLKLVGGAQSSVNVRFSTVGSALPQQPLVAGEHFDVTATLNAADARGRAELLVADEVKPMKLEGARATLTLPGRYAVDGLTGTVLFRAPDGEIDDRQDFGPLRFVTLRSRRLMVIRPGLVGRELERVPAAEADQAIDDARRALGMEIDAGEPAWIDDEELSLTSPADGPDVTSTVDLLERLHALAARTVGLEDAIWIALVPRPLRKDFHRLERAEAARAVAVCTPGDLQKLLDAEPPPAEPRVNRLRISGSVDGGGAVRLQPLRVEERAAGLGPPVESGLRAVALDAQGRVRASRPIRLLTADRPARVFVLLPVTDDVVDLEIRIDDGQPPLPSPDPFGYGTAFGAFFGGGLGGNLLALRRIHRSEGRPRVTDVEVGGGHLSFHYGHTRSARSSVVIEAGGARGWAPVLRLAPCIETGDLPLARLRLGEDDRLRVAATDGWNADLAPDRGIDLPTLPPFRAAARHAGGLRFWADVDEGGEPTVTWTLTSDPGAPEPPHRTVDGLQVTVPDDFRGTVALAVARGNQTVTDTRTVSAGGKVDCRRTEHPEETHGS